MALTSKVGGQPPTPNAQKQIIDVHITDNGETIMSIYNNYFNFQVALAYEHVAGLKDMFTSVVGELERRKQAGLPVYDGGGYQYTKNVPEDEKEN